MRSVHARLLWSAILLPVLALSACAAESSAPSRRLVIGVSVAPQAWLVEQIGGPEVAVLTMLPAGSSPTTYQPTDAQVTLLLSARAYFRIGVPFERGPWLRALASHPRIEILDQAAGITLRTWQTRPWEGTATDSSLVHHHEGDDPHVHEGDDPHVWLSPRRLVVQARTVADALARIDPGHAERYQRNLAEVVAELNALDQRLGERLAPLAGSSFFVFHPSWGYFAEDYGLRMVAIEIAGKEPTDGELTELQRFARSEGATVVFVQPQIAGRTARAVAEAVGAELVELDPLAFDLPRNLERTADALLRARGRIGARS